MVVCVLQHAARHTGVLHCIVHMCTVSVSEWTITVSAVLFTCAQLACQNGLTVRVDEHSEDILRIVAVTAKIVMELDSPSIAR